MAPWASHQDAAIGSAPLWSAANAGAVLRESGLLLSVSLRVLTGRSNRVAGPLRNRSRSWVSTNLTSE